MVGNGILSLPRYIDGRCVLQRISIHRISTDVFFTRLVRQYLEYSSNRLGNADQSGYWFDGGRIGNSFCDWRSVSISSLSSPCKASIDRFFIITRHFANGGDWDCLDPVFYYVRCGLHLV